MLLLDRNLDEILESQARMIARRGEAIEDTPERRVRLRQEYARIVEQTVCATRPGPPVALRSLPVWHWTKRTWPPQSIPGCTGIAPIDDKGR